MPEDGWELCPKPIYSSEYGKPGSLKLVEWAALEETRWKEFKGKGKAAEPSRTQSKKTAATC